MNEQQLEGLKQFIDGRIGQLEGRMEDRFEQVEDGLSGVENGLKSLQQEMLDGFSGVGEAIDEINKRFDEHIAAHQTT